MAYLVKPFSKNDLVPAIEVARGRFAEMTALDGEVRTLEERLETRKVVEQAKGRLMADQGMTEAEAFRWIQRTRSEEHTSELQSRQYLVCRLLLEKKKIAA